MARKSKKQTLSEFQAWLQGITEIQPDDWTPDATQWKMIYDKILGIKEPVIEEKIVHVQAAAPGYPPQQQLPPNSYVAPQVPSQMPVINPAEIEMTPAAKEMLAGGTKQTKTPDIDTSDGNVNSLFE